MKIIATTAIGNRIMCGTGKKTVLPNGSEGYMFDHRPREDVTDQAVWAVITYLQQHYERKIKEGEDRDRASITFDGLGKLTWTPEVE